MTSSRIGQDVPRSRAAWLRPCLVQATEMVRGGLGGEEPPGTLSAVTQLVSPFAPHWPLNFGKTSHPSTSPPLHPTPPHQSGATQVINYDSSVRVT